MDVSMLLHVGLLVETLAAERTREWTNVAVDQQVRRQRRRSLELFLTHATLELPRWDRRRHSCSSTFSSCALLEPHLPNTRRRKYGRMTQSSVIAYVVTSWFLRTRVAFLAQSFRFLVHRVEEWIPDLRCGLISFPNEAGCYCSWIVVLHFQLFFEAAIKM